LCGVTLAAGDGAGGTHRIPLSQNSIAFGLQRGDGGVLLDDDFHDLLQLLQQLLRVSWKLVQHQCHGGILLAAA
jgi:hypothetical protein